MTSEELSQHVADFIGAACSRVMGTGSAQYEQDGEQKFERMSFDELIDWTNEELQDTAVYAVMMSLRLEKIRTAISSKVDRLAEQVREIETGLAAVRSEHPVIPSLHLVRDEEG